jgi:hypothetical protein
VKKQLLEECDDKKLCMTVNWTDMHNSLEKTFLIDPIKPASSSAIALELFEGNTLNFEVQKLKMSKNISVMTKVEDENALKTLISDSQH